jgi:predicted nuclease of predicted toxin-antitoxin system
MNLLVDMNLTPRWVSYLSAAGHSAVHWSMAGSMSAEDEEICSYAREKGLVVLTNDLDFPRILACTGASGPSVILLRGSPLTPEARGAALLLILTNRMDELVAGALLSVDWTGRPRARLLPLG